MISTEMLIIMLIFLAYIAVWYAYMHSFMDVVEKGMEKLDDKYYADLIAYKINVLCLGNGRIVVDAQKRIDVNADGVEISVNNLHRKIKCNATGSSNSREITLVKENGIIIIS